jgi:fructose-bisphosphate aldolase class I
MNAPLETTVSALLASGKGILAADESLPTIEKRFKPLDIPCTEENRRAYREMLFTTAGLGEFISGVIFFDETIRQRTAGGIPLPEVLTKQGIIPGIKVDHGTIELAGCPGEKITEGLDGLFDRLIQYRELGARFTKWRAVITIGPNLPSHACLEANVDALASFAALSQKAGLVPIVEPEVLMDGDHSIARCEEVMTLTLKTVFEALAKHGVVLEQMLLKTGMVLSGAECPEPADDETIAAATLRCLSLAVPAAVPGIVFLSGGQNDQEATRRLNVICSAGDAPWKITFSYGRALQDQAMKTWKGISENVSAAQAALHHRARCNGLATQGQYSAAIESSNDQTAQKAGASSPP